MGILAADERLLPACYNSRAIAGSKPGENPEQTEKPMPSGVKVGQALTCRGSGGGGAQPAVSDTSSGHGSGSTVPPARPDPQGAKPQLGNPASKPPARKRDLT